MARVLSKQGLCSRSEAARWIADGRVAIDGRVLRDPEHAVTRAQWTAIRIDGHALAAAPRRYLMLNKPRGLVTTSRDERGRDTVYACLGDDLGWLAPVGRLDKASEGLLLFTSDSAWAARITDPATGPRKVYHVQVDAIPDAALLARIATGIDDAGERLAASRVAMLRAGAKHAWLEIVLEAGRNRHIRRLLAAFGLRVLRLVRVAIGPVALGDLAKGQWRELDAGEIAALRGD